MVLSTQFCFHLTHVNYIRDSGVGIRRRSFSAGVPAGLSLRMRGPQRNRQGIEGWAQVACARGLSKVLTCWLGSPPRTHAQVWLAGSSTGGIVFRGMLPCLERLP